MQSIYDFKVKTADGTILSLSDYHDHVLLIVNVASKCGFTPQYEELETLYQRYKANGLMILAFPCNQFAFQEPGDNKEIMEFCTLNYQITFPVLSKVNVNGKDAEPLFVFLKSHQKGVLGTESIKWNFTKFLISRDGEVLGRFSPSASPFSFEDTLKNALGI